MDPEQAAFSRVMDRVRGIRGRYPKGAIPVVPQAFGGRLRQLLPDELKNRLGHQHDATLLGAYMVVLGSVEGMPGSLELEQNLRLLPGKLDIDLESGAITTGPITDFQFASVTKALNAAVSAFPSEKRGEYLERLWSALCEVVAQDKQEGRILIASGRASIR